MTMAYACDCMYMCVNFWDEIFLREGGGGGGGGNLKLEKNSIFLKKSKTVICRNSICGKPKIFLDLG